MKANVSLCIIVKNEPLLENCLLSIREYVSEIVVVDTGSTDNTPETAKKYADIFEVYTDCNNKDTGLIEDFSKARNRSFELANQPWVLWCDADDIIIGGEYLAAITKEFEQIKDDQKLDGVGYLFPYEYSHNAEGLCTCKHFRERLFYNKNNFKFVNPVHEVAIPNENKNIALIQRQELLFVHKREVNKESGRNLRILRKYFEKYGDQDPRQIYYLGLECTANGLHDEAIDLLAKYIDVSGWDEERMMACLKLVDICHMKADYENGLKWALKAISIEEQWFEGYFSACKMYYFLAQKNSYNAHRNWERCINFGTTALSMPPTRTVLFINPLDREIEIYKYLNVAYNTVGDVKSALNCTNLGLEKHKDSSMECNKKLYEQFIIKSDAITVVSKLKDFEVLKENEVNTILNIINDKNQDKNCLLNNSIISSSALSDGDFPISAITDDERQWAIPNTYDFNSLPIKIDDKQLQAVVIMLWKQYILHDEVMLGIKFLENAPYSVRNTTATLMALNMNKAMIAWITDTDLAQKHNAPEEAVIDLEIGAVLPNPLVGQQGSRFDAIVEHLDPTTPENPISLLDFGSFDGAFTNRYAMRGYKVTGIDLVKTSIKLANRKALEFNTGATHIECYFQDVDKKLPHHSFDCATSTESYEHLINPVEDMLMPAKKVLKDTGKFLLSCPHGAWFRGEHMAWAHPWIFPGSWLGPFPRGHLRAPDVWTLANDFKEAGYWVKNSFVMLSDFPDVPGQGNVFSEAYVQAPDNENSKDIIFYIGNGVEQWTPNTIKKTGMGGSELMAMEMAKRLALQGNRVRVYNSCGLWGEGIYDGVEYYQTEKYQDLECDILIVSRRADMIDDKYDVKAKLKLLWVHDVCAINATNKLLLKYDRILALSEWHKQNIINTHHLHPDHVIVTRNAIDMSRFNKKIERNKFKAVNSSSPDRSWPILLECWPEIKKQVPEAELHLYYGFKNWEFSAQNDPNQLALIERIKKEISNLGSKGVVFHDRINQEELAKEFLSAGVWAHSTWFTETSCITAMEAQAAGLRMVTSSIAALNETVADRGVLLSGDWTSIEYRSSFINAVVIALKKEEDEDRVLLQQYAKENFGFDCLLNDWNRLFTELLEEIKVNPIVKYCPIQ